MLMEKCQQAKQNASAALALVRGQMNLANGAQVFASCDDHAQAESLLDEARNLYPKNTVLASILGPVLRAEAERDRGNTAQALQFSETLRSYDLGVITGVVTNYARGNLYLAQRKGNEAAAEFKRIIDTPGVESYSPAHVLAHLGLGRAAAINGDTAGARKAYQDFFALWKDADPDLPPLIQARREYEQLK
jgi:tetratricopeptide (TPR) repeat protein